MRVGWVRILKIKLNKNKFNTAYPDKAIDWRDDVYATSDRLIYKPSMLFRCLWLVVVTVLCVLLVPIYAIHAIIKLKFNFEPIRELYHQEQRVEWFDESLCSGRCLCEK